MHVCACIYACVYMYMCICMYAYVYMYILYKYVCVYMEWRRKWQPTPVSLPGESQGQKSLVASICRVTQSQTCLKWLSSSSIYGDLEIYRDIFWRYIDESANPHFLHMKDFTLCAFFFTLLSFLSYISSIDSSIVVYQDLPYSSSVQLYIDGL